jgi:Ala-tRNA(Pro) deacylase
VTTSATPDDLFAFLDGSGRAQTATHAPLFTVEQSQALRGTIRAGTPRTCS